MYGLSSPSADPALEGSAPRPPRAGVGVYGRRLSGLVNMFVQGAEMQTKETAASMGACVRRDIQTHLSTTNSQIHRRHEPQARAAPQSSACPQDHDKQSPRAGSVVLSVGH